MIAAEQDVGHRSSAEDAGAGVVGVIQGRSVVERVLLGRALVAQDPGHQATDRLDDAQGRELASGQDEVTYRELIPLQLVRIRSSKPS